MKFALHAGDHHDPVMGLRWGPGVRAAEAARLAQSCGKRAGAYVCTRAPHDDPTHENTDTGTRWYYPHGTEPSYLPVNLDRHYADEFLDELARLSVAGADRPELIEFVVATFEQARTR